MFVKCEYVHENLVYVKNKKVCTKCNNHEKESTYRECKKCKTMIQRDRLSKNKFICPNCGNLIRIHAYDRIGLLADENSFCEWDVDLKNNIEEICEDYAEKIVENSKKHNLSEAIIVGEMYINGQHVAIGVMDSRFMMGSMGRVVGEKVTRLFERAIKKKLPVILFCCSGGARMQEGILSLMQMEKTAAAVKRHNNAGLLYISVLTNPTMGGVSASFAMVADIVLAEEGSQIGFTGPRVIEQTTNTKLPDNFQTAEFQRDHGFIDAILDRENKKEVLSFLLRFHQKKVKRNRINTFVNKNELEKEAELSDMPAWERVQIARRIDRPTTLDYIDNLFSDFYEIHGDRVSGDDHAIVGGIATFNSRAVTVIGNQKGKGSISDKIYRNWGMASPQGHRKVLRLAKQAEKFLRPIVLFVDTIGADCREAAEENGQGVAIANLLQEMSTIKVPVLSIVIGEGGSGGALAMGVGNEVWMLENSIYSILTPEGYASIVWKDSSRGKDAATVMDLCARELYRLKIVDDVIREKEPVTRENMEEICVQLRKKMETFFTRFEKKSQKHIVNERYIKFRSY